MEKKGKKAQAGKPKKLTPKDVGKRLDTLVKKLGEELEGGDLFAPLPPTEDCAICFVPLSHDKPEIRFQACCGNIVCLACCKENEASIKKQNDAGKKVALTCRFCREPESPSAKEEYVLLQARCLQNDHHALSLMGEVHQDGKYGKAKDGLKALDCFIRAVELGSAVSCAMIAEGYNEGNGVAVDKERAALFQRVAALRGDIVARHNIGIAEYHTFGNHEIAIRHWKVAAEAGDQDSLIVLRIIYNGDGKVPGKEFISKDYLESTYRACHDAQMEVKTEEREKHRSEEESENQQVPVKI